MRITWVTRSFLDYRIPVYKALDELCGNNLTVIYNGDVVPRRCQEKLGNVLGDRNIPLTGEKRLCGVEYDNATMANKGFRIPIQKGLIKKIRETKPDVMISDGFFQWTYAPLLVRMFNLRHIRHIMCYERTPHTERNAGKLRTIYRKLVSHWIDAIDCNGSLTAKYVTESLHYRKPLAYGHMAAETEGIRQRVEAVDETEINDLRKRFSLKETVFLYVGQLIPRKGIMEMLRAWEKASLQDSTLFLVGDGSQRKEVEDYIKNRNLKNVILAGSVNYDELGPYYRVADCFIIPTLEDNWSLVVPEAMAAGLPIACSVYNGCYPELVRQENGWLFDPLDNDLTAKKLNKIYQSHESFKEMGECSRRIVSNFSPQLAARALYDACLNARAKLT